MMLVPVTGDLWAQVDDGDFDLVSLYRWCRFVDKHRIYARRFWTENGRQRGQFMHSLITGLPLVDHVDHDGLNNQRYNLRDGSGVVNARNSRSFVGSSQFKGVSWHKVSRKWTAQIWYDGRLHGLGSFLDEEEAARAYDQAAVENFGDHAYLNFQIAQGGARP
jgi:hypothetical protein